VVVVINDRFFQAAMDALPDPTAVLDPSASIVAVNRAWRMFGLDNGGHPGASGPGVNYLDVCARAAEAGCTDARLAAEGLMAVLDGQTVHSELEYACPSPGASRWFLLRMTPLSGGTGGAVASHVNITRRKQAEQALAHEAAHDPLTGLANRSLFASRLASALARPGNRLPGSQVGVLFLDVDGFKQLNDVYGHAAGDEVLLTIGHRLRSHVRPQDTVARLGGDEFAVAAPRITADGLAGLAGRVSGALQEPHLIHGRLIIVRVSVGRHLATPGDAAEDALGVADQAMYAAKRDKPDGARPSPPPAR
jgi:diguanylate cyclase (GGDEF)-like protein